MHELNAVKRILGILSEECERNGLKCVDGAELLLGSLTSFKKEPILFYFDGLKKSYPRLKGSVLKITPDNAALSCRSCGKVSVMEDEYITSCPSCGSSDAEIIGGRSLNIVAIEGEKYV